jgi:hypothetical protein
MSLQEYFECEYLPKGYKVSINGDIINKYNKKLKSRVSNSGYLFYNLKDNKKQRGLFLHRCLAVAFIENTNNKEQVNHIDGNKLNNSLCNLEWATRSENVKHAYDSGLKKYRPLHYKGKLGLEHNRSKKVICIETGEIFGSMSEASRKLKIAISSVSWSVKYEKPIKK